MADVFELELHDLPEDDPSRAPDSDDDIIDIDEVIIQNSRRMYLILLITFHSDFANKNL